MRVLVTRPEPGATATAARLRERGHEPVALPLSRTVAIDDVALPDGDFDAVVVTSANALRHAPTEFGERFGDLRLFAVGDRTADVARQAGVEHVESANGDVRDLASLVTRKLPAGSRLLYLCGRRRRPELEAALRERGFTAVPLETYATEQVDRSPEQLAVTIGEGPIDAVLLYSPFAAELLNGIAGEPSVTAQFATVRLLCMSWQITDRLGPELRARAEIAAQADEESLFALL
ncbi:MAG: uroporphyrinogen-III synthase [Rhizobiaceae bacterium]|nr:uroporphyrinogen-III synthase [Rhizobiaceae bacterium]